MERDEAREAPREDEPEPAEKELLEARRRKLRDKLRSRGLIKGDDTPEDEAEENPAGA